MQSIPELIELFKQGTAHLKIMAQDMDFPWKPDEPDCCKLHNVYVRNLITCYINKYEQLAESILYALRHEHYLVYALSGRSLIEMVATLRYYNLHQYKPLLEKGSLSQDDLKRLIEIDDRQLRGSRFDWESFLFQRYSKMKEDAARQLKKKKDKSKTISDLILKEQVNVLTCIEKWAKDTPEVLIAYNLFCDLVHPNIGSSFLIASVDENGLYFSPTKERKIGKDIFEQSFPILLSVNKPFGEYIAYLMCTMWQDDELN